MSALLAMATAFLFLCGLCMCGHWIRTTLLHSNNQQQLAVWLVGVCVGLARTDCPADLTRTDCPAGLTRPAGYGYGYIPRHSGSDQQGTVGQNSFITCPSFR